MCATLPDTDAPVGRRGVRVRRGPPRPAPGATAHGRGTSSTSGEAPRATVAACFADALHSPLRFSFTPIAVACPCNPAERIHGCMHRVEVLLYALRAFLPQERVEMPGLKAAFSFFLLL